MEKLTIEELAIFAKRKGFVYPSGEIYGGIAGFWDFGVLGTEMKKNLKDEWWKFHVQEREEIVGIDGSIITNPRVWEASGHVSNFVDVAVVNKNTGEKKKIDKHEVKEYENNKDWEVQGEFNPMFTTQVGPIKKDSAEAYLRPETAQLIFANFKSVQENSRLKLPFGIAQIGKSFRNEISPREFLFRSREFEQMEIEYFIAPDQKCPFLEEIKDTQMLVLSEEMQKKDQSEKKMNLLEAVKKGIIRNEWHAYFLAIEFKWFVSLGATAEKFRIRQHCSDEKSHYATDTWDLEFKFPMGWRELEGVANRGNYDLIQHQKFSKKKMEIDDPGFGKVIPHVVCEPSLGVERAFIVFLADAYSQDNERKNIVLKLSPRLSPYKLAVLPLVSKGDQYEKSREIYDSIKKHFSVLFDKSGSIGRRYARNDEIGTPFCLTVDDQTLKDNTITLRDRDTTNQIRIKLEQLNETLNRLCSEEIKFDEIK